MAEFSFSQKQLTWFKVEHLEDWPPTWATHANRHAGGVAKAWFENKARETTAEKTVEARMLLLYIMSECGELQSEVLVSWLEE